MRIHITGASGSGTSTLGRAVATALRLPFIDADDFYWMPTAPPYTQKREPPDRLALLLDAVRRDPHGFVLAGSILRWGPAIEDSFDLIVFLYLETSVRVERLRQREIAEVGHADPAFLAWAAAYDDGPPEGRSLVKHRAWLAERRCPILQIDGDLTVAERLALVLNATGGM